MIGCPSTSTRAPYRSAMRCLIRDATSIDERCTITAQHAASHGLQKHTGRSPGRSRWRSPSTGSASPSLANPAPSTSRERIRATSPLMPGPAARVVATSTPPGAPVTLTPIGRQSDSAQ